MRSKNLKRRLFELAAMGLTEKDTIKVGEYLERFNWDMRKGEYTNMITQAMWLGYCLVGASQEGNPNSHYVIAKEVAGRPNFSMRPYTHHDYQGSYAELQRLAEKYPGTKFLLYKSITAIRIGEAAEFVWPEPLPESPCPCPNVAIKFEKTTGETFCLGQCPDTGPENQKITVVLEEK